MGKRGPSKGNEYWITTKEVAEKLGWSIRKVQRYAKIGEIPVQRRLGEKGDFRFNRKDIEIFKRSLYRPYS